MDLSTNKISALETTFESENSIGPIDLFSDKLTHKQKNEDILHINPILDCSDDGDKTDNDVDFSVFNKARAKKKYSLKNTKAVTSFHKSNNFDMKPKPLRSKKSDLLQIHSEVQRLGREAIVKIPEYNPAPIILEEVLNKLPKLSGIHCINCKNTYNNNIINNKNNKNKNKNNINNNNDDENDNNNSNDDNNNSNYDNNNQLNIGSITSTPLIKHECFPIPIEFDDLPDIDTILQTADTGFSNQNTGEIESQNTLVQIKPNTDILIDSNRYATNETIDNLDLKNNLNLNVDCKLSPPRDSLHTSKVILTGKGQICSNNTKLTGIERFKLNFMSNNNSTSKMTKENSISSSISSTNFDTFLSTKDLEKISNFPDTARSFLRDKLKQCILEKRLNNIEAISISNKIDNEEYSLDEYISNDNNALLTEAEEYKSNDNLEIQTNDAGYSDIDDEADLLDSDCNVSPQKVHSAISVDEDSLSYENYDNAHRAKRLIITDDVDSDVSIDESNCITNTANTADNLFNINSCDIMPNNTTTGQNTQDPESVMHEVVPSAAKTTLLDMESTLNANENSPPSPVSSPDYFIVKSNSSYNPESRQSQISIPVGIQDLCSEASNSQAKLDELLNLCSGQFTQDSVDIDHPFSNYKSSSNNSFHMPSTSPNLSIYPSLSSHERLDLIRYENIQHQDQIKMDAPLNDTIGNDIMPKINRKINSLRVESKYANYKRLADFEEKEAELSGSDFGEDSQNDSDEYGHMLDEYEPEEGDTTIYDIDEEHSKVADIHNRLVFQNEEAQIAILKDRFIHGEDIIEDGLKMRNGHFRKRKFNVNDYELYCDSDTQNDDSSGSEQESKIDLERRKLRLEREHFLKERSFNNISEFERGLPPKLFNQIIVNKSKILTSKDMGIHKYNLFKKSISGSSSLLNRILSDPSSLDSSELQKDSNSYNKFASGEQRRAYVFQDNRSLTSNSTATNVNKSEFTEVNNEQRAKRIKTSLLLDMECNMSSRTNSKSIFNLIN